MSRRRKFALLKFAPKPQPLDGPSAREEFDDACIEDTMRRLRMLIAADRVHGFKVLAWADVLLERAGFAGWGRVLDATRKKGKT